MQPVNLSNITIDKIELPSFRKNGLEAEVLRLDKIHPQISGNKWFKLRYYLDEAKQLNKKSIVTFGGAWSNHIIATAAACKLHGFISIGIIRGEEPAELSPTLQEAKAMGMQFIFVSRENYRQKRMPVQIDPDGYIINEGGYGIKGAEGAAGILDHCQKENYTHICCAAGTGTMAAGLAIAAGKETRIVAVSVMKSNPEIGRNIELFSKKNTFELQHDYHFGGYAKHTPGLIHFMNDFYQSTSIPSDFVYTGKLFYAINDLATKKYFPAGSRLLLIHSGGLQGNASLSKGTLIF